MTPGYLRKGRSVRRCWTLFGWCIALSSLVTVQLTGCGKVGSGDSESHFLKPCEANQDCADLEGHYSCQDGFCRIAPNALAETGGSGGVNAGAAGASITQEPPVRSNDGTGGAQSRFPSYCVHEGVKYAIDEYFEASDGCGSCVCTFGGRVRCDLGDCACVNAGDLHAMNERVGFFSEVEGASGASGLDCEACRCETRDRINCQERFDCDSEDICVVGSRWYPVGASWTASDDCNTCTCEEDGQARCTDEVCQCEPEREWWRRYDDDGAPDCPPGTQVFENACGTGCEQPRDCPEWITCLDQPGGCDRPTPVLEPCPYSELAAPSGAGPVGDSALCGSLSNSAVLYDPSCLACVEAECCYELGGCLSGDETCGDYSRCAIDCQRTRDRTSVSLMECLETTCPDLVEAAMTNPAMQAARSCAAESCPGACQPGTL